MAMARESAAVATRSTVSAEAKLALLEELQRSPDASAAAQSAAEWLLAQSAAERTVFAASDHVRGVLTGVAGAGVSSRQVKKLSLSLENNGHPLVNALSNGSPVSLHASRDAPVRILGDAP